MNWQRDPHDRRWETIARRAVSVAVLALTLTLIALAADNCARFVVLAWGE